MAPPLATVFAQDLPNGQKLFASYYLFKAVGDEIPLHEHTFWHSCCCLTGKVEVYDHTGKSVMVEAGHFVEFKAGRKHAIRAVAHGTTIINISEPDRTGRH